MRERLEQTVGAKITQATCDKNVNAGILCIKCNRSCRTRSAYCTSGKHWVHYKCQKMTSQEIAEIELEEENDDNYTCKICNGNIAIEGEAKNTQTSQPIDSQYQQLALPTCSNNASSILADAGATREEEVCEAELCGICEGTIEDNADSCEICQNIAHSSCLVCSDGQTTCFPCIDTIKRTSKIQVNSNIDEHQTYVKLGETPKEQQTTINGKPQSELPNHQHANSKTILRPADVCIEVPPTKASKSKQDQTDTKTKDMRERELKLRKAEEQLKIREKTLKEDQAKSILLETRVQYLEARNFELESLVTTMRRRLEELQGNSSTADNKKQPGEEQPGIFEQMQKKLNNRMMTIHEKLASMVMDQVEKQIDSVATSLLSTDNTTKQYEKASQGDPSLLHKLNDDHENPKDDTASNSYVMNLNMAHHIVDENIHLQVQHRQQPESRQDYHQPKMAAFINQHIQQPKMATFINQNIQPQPMLTGMPLIRNTVQPSVPFVNTIPLRVSQPSNNRQADTLQPRATHAPDRRHVTVKDRRYAEHNNQAKPPKKQKLAKTAEEEGVTVLKIISFNCKNAKSNIYALHDLMENNDILLLQEHWLFHAQLHYLQEIGKCTNYAAKGSDEYDPIQPTFLPRGHGGVAVIWKNEIDSQVRPLDDGKERIQCVEISGKDQKLLVVSVYLPSTGGRNSTDEFLDTIDQLNEIITKYQDTHEIIIGGDLNEDLGNDERQNKRKKYLQQLIEDYRLGYENTGKRPLLRQMAKNVPNLTTSCISPDIWRWQKKRS
ncbi:Hypothetical predicted protein [Mytilus galloprovincialis]|uniref:Endonuclease/exonuclease/phosphatase domain-containing protein n=1 Tax=Mytilus galloprovincialis TaxID=29158 RepID=A0A8B6D3R1_MYTGA|nr:Hypothetical predicted protein [Mytilus galloprovincialis]